MTVWWSGKEQSEHNSIRNQGTGQGNGNNQDKKNNQTGTSDKHKLLVQKEKLEAQGDYGSSQWQVLNNYLSGVEQKYQSEGRS